MTTTYEVNEYGIVFRIETWEDGSQIKSIIGMYVSARDVIDGVDIVRFELDQFVVKEFIDFIEGDDEEQTQFKTLVASRTEYWQTEGSAT
jgi:hypothetical protein